MKRIIAALLAVLMVCALLAACGERTVKTSVDAKYDEGFAKSYAKSTGTDDNGNTTYEFTGDKYDEFVYDYRNSVAKEITSDIASKHDDTYGQYAYVNVDKKAVIIGLNPGEYDAAEAEAEAPAHAENAFKVFKNLENPISTITVQYVNANDQDEVYGSFEFTAE